MDHDGSPISGVVVNGSAAYVAAESANLTINDGLFDIEVTGGSDTALQHAGATIWEASDQSGVQRMIYLMSVPKNNALSLLLSPTRLGFERGKYLASYTLTRSEGATIMVVDYTTDFSRR